MSHSQMKNDIDHLEEGSLLLLLDSRCDVCLQDAAVIKRQTAQSLTWETMIGGEPKEDEAVIFDEAENAILSYGLLAETVIHLDLVPESTVVYRNVGTEPICVDKVWIAPGGQLEWCPVAVGNTMERSGLAHSI